MTHGEEGESVLVAKGPCETCGSSDACATYSDGHAYCFSCRKYYSGNGKPVEGLPPPKRPDGLLEGWTPAGGLKKRNLTEETCKKWSYTVGRDKKGRLVQIAPYRDSSGRVVGQKLRYHDKRGFPWVGTSKGVQLFGAHLWGSGKKLVITEGELDALSVSQVQNHKWPVVSLINGASSAKRDLLKHLDYLKNFEEVILMFDQDEPGQKAAQEAAQALSGVIPVKIATLPLKDANELVAANRGAEVVSAIWNATPYRPEGLVRLSDLKERIKSPIEMGLPWCFPELTKLTYGRRLGEIYSLGAGTGVGKTDLLTQQVAFDLTELKEKVGIFFLEQQPEETGKRIAGKLAGKRFHIPDGDWTQEELEETVEELAEDDRLYLYDHFGHADWDTIASHIQYLAGAEGVKIFYVDHLTALATGGDAQEKEALERIMSEMGSLVKKLNIILVLVSHLATPEGKPHEEGGRVTIRHFKGSRAIGFWSHFMFGLERNQQAEEPEERETTTFRILKDRYTGNATGEVIALGYDRDKGLLFVKETYKEEPPEDELFDDETDTEF